jgi:hypothetical protein
MVYRPVGSPGGDGPARASGLVFVDPCRQCSARLLHLQSLGAMNVSMVYSGSAKDCDSDEQVASKSTESAGISANTLFQGARTAHR